jgi:hypothetical protein
MIDGGLDEAAALNRHLVGSSRAGAKPERRFTTSCIRDSGSLRFRNRPQRSIATILIIHRRSSRRLVAVLPNVSDRSAGKQTKATRTPPI